MVKQWYCSTYRVTFYFCSSIQETNTEVNRDFPDEQPSDIKSLGIFKMWSLGDEHPRKAAIYAKTPAALVHECLHAVTRIMQIINQPIHADYDEVAAYLIEDIFLQYCKAINPDWNKGKQSSLDKLKSWGIPVQQY